MPLVTLVPESRPLIGHTVLMLASDWSLIPHDSVSLRGHQVTRRTDSLEEGEKHF